LMRATTRSTSPRSSIAPYTVRKAFAVPQ
jgi:hypothetical protein